MIELTTETTIYILKLSVCTFWFCWVAITLKRLIWWPKGKAARKGIRCFWQDCKKPALLVHGTRFTFCEEHGEWKTVRPKSIDVKFNQEVDVRFDWSSKRGDFTGGLVWDKPLGISTALKIDPSWKFGWQILNLKPPTKFKVGDWVRIKDNNGWCHLDLCKVVDLLKDTGYRLDTSCGNRAVIGGERLEPALPRESEWWKDECCNVPHHHSFMESCPFVALNDWHHSVNAERVRCGCLRPVNFGRGEQGSDPIEKNENTSENRSVSRTSFPLMSERSCSGFETEFKPGDWIRHSDRGLGRVTERPGGGFECYGAEFLEGSRRVHPNKLKLALPLKGEWWEWRHGLCQHESGVGHTNMGVQLVPETFKRLIPGRGPYDWQGQWETDSVREDYVDPAAHEAATCGCLIPVNFGKGNGG